MSTVYRRVAHRTLVALLLACCSRLHIVQWARLWYHVLSHEWLPAVWRNLLPPSSYLPWRWKQHVPLFEEMVTYEMLLCHDTGSQAEFTNPWKSRAWYKETHHYACKQWFFSGGTRTRKHFVNLTEESKNFKMLEFPLTNSNRIMDI
jgi:hypothetical protein